MTAGIARQMKYLHSAASIDRSGVYRYNLERVWKVQGPRLCFIMLNPSTADATINDPTIARCSVIAERLGYAGMEVVNLFAYRATNPVALKKARYPVGLDNDKYISQGVRRADAVLLAWGNHGSHQDRDKKVLNLMGDTINAFCLGTTKLNQPRHPLYLSLDAEALTKTLTRYLWHDLYSISLSD